MSPVGTPPFALPTPAVGYPFDRPESPVQTDVDCYVPLGGLPQDVLTKATGTDFDVMWLPAAAASLPLGGTTGQALTKLSNANGDANWRTAADEVWVGVAAPVDPASDLWYDTSTTPGSLKVKIGGTWTVAAATAPEEVVVSPTDPRAANPAIDLWVDTSVTPAVIRINDGTNWITGSEVYVGTNILTRLSTDPSTELWYDITSLPHVLKVRVAGTWEAVASGSEVEVTPVDPYVTDPTSVAELWYDTNDPPTLKVRVGGTWRALETPLGGVLPALDFGLPPSPGTSTSASHADHSHGTPDAPPGATWSVTVEPVVPGDTIGRIGVSDDGARGDHTHPGVPALGGVIPQLQFGMPPSPGRSTASSRADHEHGTPELPPAADPIDYGTVIAAKTYDLPPSSGQSDTVSRSDHEHGTPRSEVAISDDEPSTPKDLWVNTAVNPHTLMAYVGNAYVPVGAAGEVPPNEVQIGGPDPTQRYPEAELWYDTAADPPTLKARVNDQWVDVTAAGTSEVEIAPSDPYTTDPLCVAELWFDTAANVRALKVRENGTWVKATPDFGTVFPQLSFGMQSFPGVSEEASRADHSHGTPALADGASEVEITPDDPTTANPDVELWVDTDENVLVPAPADDEVYVGPSDPQAAGGTQELWFNTGVIPPILLAWSAGAAAWLPASTAESEVHVGPADPYINPDSDAELWYDTSGLAANPPTTGVLRARVLGAWQPATGSGLVWRGAWSAATVYVQGDAVSYDNPTALPSVGPGVSSYECLGDTFLGAPPPPNDITRWRLIVEVGEKGEQGDQGEPGLIWRGVWDGTLAYSWNEAVTYNAPFGVAPGVSSFRCISPVTGGGANPTPDTDPAHWEMLAQAGLPGEQGEPGMATVIVGDFGQSKTPADLPIDGLIPQDWDAVGNPAGAYQMIQGQSLFYAPIAGPADPLDGHMFQYVGTNADPSGWLDIGIIKGPPGDPGILWRGEWDATASYVINDGVYSAGSSWRCLYDHGPGYQPPELNVAFWTLLASKGEDATYNGTTDVWVGPDEPPITTAPNTELWYDTDEVPAVPTHAMRAFWQPDVAYVPGDQVLWPESAADIRMATRETIGEEPGVTGINDAVNFADTTATTSGLSAVLASVSYAAGVDVRLNTGSGYAIDYQSLGGFMVTATNAGNLPVFSLSVATGIADPLVRTLQFGVLTNVAVPTIYEVPLPGLRWLRAAADVATNTLRIYESANGVDWTELGTGLVSTDPLLTAGVTAIHLGHDNDEPTHNHRLELTEVETFDFGGARQTSWVAFTQPSNPDGPNYDAAVTVPGAGISPQTGESYAIVGSAGAWQNDRYPAWQNVTSAVQWLTEPEETTALSGEGITFYGGRRIFESGGMLYVRGPHNGTAYPGVNAEWAGYIVISGARAGNANARFYRDAFGSANGTQENVLDARSGDSRNLWWVQSFKRGYNSGTNEATQITAVAVGGWGNQWAYQTTIASPPGLDTNGSVSAADMLDRSAAATKDEVADLDRDVAGRLIDALHPVTYRRIIPPGDVGDDPEARVDMSTAPDFRRVGFTVENIEESGTPLREHLVRHLNYDTATGQPVNAEERGYSIPGLLAVAIAEIKALRARVAELEGQSPTAPAAAAAPPETLPRRRPRT